MLDHACSCCPSRVLWCEAVLADSRSPASAATRILCAGAYRPCHTGHTGRASRIKGSRCAPVLQRATIAGKVAVAHGDNNFILDGHLPQERRQMRVDGCGITFFARSPRYMPQLSSRVDSLELLTCANATCLCTHEFLCQCTGDEMLPKLCCQSRCCADSRIEEAHHASWIGGADKQRAQEQA